MNAVNGVHYIVILLLSSWCTTPRIGRQYGPLFAASTSTELSICHQPGLADVSPRQFSSLPYFSLGSTHLLFSSVFLLLEMERKRKKERTAGGGEGENR
jgi:hypothetical protein